MAHSIGGDYLILSFALTTSFSSITTDRPFLAVLLQEKDGQPVVIRKSASATTEWNMNDPLSIEGKKYPNSGTTTTICQAKVAAGTGTLQVILTLG
ncbi:MAG TPA: hypothetical protein VEF04_05495 [Blastocatellia bacterium]|nr:hypothetical protein [Blastocatellia bacterium]